MCGLREEDVNSSEPFFLNLDSEIHKRNYTSNGTALKLENTVLEYTQLQTSTYFFLKQIHLNILQTAINMEEKIMTAKSFRAFSGLKVNS